MMQLSPKIIFLIFSVTAAALMMTACKKKAHQHADGYYTCSMHPQVISHEPGDCPICHMKLTFVAAPNNKQNNKKEEKTGDAKTSDENFVFALEQKVLFNANLATTKVVSEKLSRKVRYNAHIDYNEDPSHLVVINTKYDGWIETLNVSKEGQKISAGQTLMGVYSPSILSAKEEYIATYNAIKNMYMAQGKSIEEIANDPTLKAARRKLQYLDVPDNQINQLEKENSAPRRTFYTSPISGVIIKKNILQGSFIKAGDEILRIANLNSLWVYIHIFDKDLPFTQIGQKVTVKINAYPDREFHGVIDLIYPFIDPQTKDIKVRIIVQNSHGLLKPGMFADVAVETNFSQPMLQIPESSVIYSGDKNYVFVSLGEGHFELRPVIIKFNSEGRSIIAKGLTVDEMVVYNSQFLLDSEASLKELLSKTMPSPQHKTSGAELPTKREENLTPHKH